MRTLARFAASFLALYATAGLPTRATSQANYNANSNVAIQCAPNTTHSMEHCLTYLAANQTTEVGNQRLTTGYAGFVSNDRRFWFGFQGDGNVVLYFYPERFDQNPGNRQVLWASGTSIPPQPQPQPGSPAYQPYFKWQGDGNLVAYAYATYRDTKGVVWASGTDRRGALFKVQDDGNVIIADANDRVVWATNTCCH